jgi:hypothetical protein
MIVAGPDSQCQHLLRPTTLCLITLSDPKEISISDLVLLRPIILFANTDVSTTKMYLDTSILMKSNMGRREY